MSTTKSDVKRFYKKNLLQILFSLPSFYFPKGLLCEFDNTFNCKNNLLRELKTIYKYKLSNIWIQEYKF